MGPIGRCTGLRQLNVNESEGPSSVVIDIMTTIKRELDMGLPPQQRLVTEMSSSRGDGVLEGNVTANFGAPFLKEESMQ